MKCPSGHEGNDDQKVCGECGAVMSPSTPPSDINHPTTASADPPDSAPDGPEPRLGSLRRHPGRGVAIAVAVLAVAATAFFVLRDDGMSEEERRAASEAAALVDRVRGDPSAIGSQLRYCEDELSGDVDPLQSEFEQLKLESYCSQLEEAFEEGGEPETGTFEGTFTLSDASAYEGETSGSPCTGEGSSDYVRPGAEVEVRDETGTVLETASLDQGSIDGGSCVFDFELQLTEGSDKYVLRIDGRNELTYDWDEINSEGFSILLG